MQMSEGLHRITYGEKETANCRGEISELFPFLQIKLTTHNLPRSIGDSRLTTQLIGQYNFENVMAAVHVGDYFGVEPKQIKEAIESYSPSNNRSQILKRGTNTFILDAYNANPSSMDAALENFFSLPAENKIVILGDMAELGAASESEHTEIIRKLQTGNCKLVCLVGEEFRKVLSPGNDSFLHFKNVEQLKEWFSKQSFENYFFLLKASRIIGLERLLS
jgi:UDP-N-acetylmuramoyl-tripeptide--D-alanyl-D-alanine ligase